MSLCLSLSLSLPSSQRNLQPKTSPRLRHSDQELLHRGCSLRRGAEPGSPELQGFRWLGSCICI